MIQTLLKFIDWLIKLPEEYQEKLNYEISKLEEEYKMPYVTSWERGGIKKGVKQEKLETARRMLNDGVSIEKIAKYTGLSEKEIRQLLQ
jgi:predicted transposase/invertase (TIGR01784 family)